MHVTNDDMWKESYALTETDVFDRTHMCSADSPNRVLRDSTHAMQINCILLSKRR